MRAYLRTISISRRYQLNGRRLAGLVKRATLLGVLVSFLLAQCTPAQAISSSYSAFAQTSFTACGEPVGCLLFGAQPGGIGITVFPGFTSMPPPIQIGDASAFSSGGTGGGVDIPPTVNATVEVSGSASAPPDSFAASLASAVRPGVFINLTNTTQVFPVFFRHVGLAGSSLGQDQFASAHAHASLRFLVDGNLLIGGDATPGSPLIFVQGLLIPLTPGFHSWLLEVQADGFASAQLEPTPEPTTLLLFGTTAVGVGLARFWRYRTRNRKHAA